MGDLADCDQIWIGGLPPETDDAFLKGIFGAYGEIVWCKTLRKDPGQNCSALVQFGDAQDAHFCANNLNGNRAEGLDKPVKVKLSPPNQGGGGGGGGKGGGKDGGKGPGGGGQPFGGKGGNFSHPYQQQLDPAFAMMAGKGFGGKRGAAGMIKGAYKGGQLRWGFGPPENCIFVRGLPVDTTDRDLYEMFAPFGAIPPGGVLAQRKKDSENDECNGIGFVDFVDGEVVDRAIESYNGLPTPEGQFLFVKRKAPKRVQKVVEEDPEALARALEQSMS